MAKKKTHDEYVAELAIKNPNLTVLEKYINDKTPILHKCNLDEHVWKISPNNTLHGCGCPMCAGNKKKTIKEYKQELANINPNIEVIEEYIDAKTPILHQCNIDGYVWKTSPNNVLGGHGCPACARQKVGEKNSKSHNQYVKEIAIINPNIEVVEQYSGSHIPILHRCKIDGHEWKPTPDSILHGCGCPKCAGNQKKTTEQYKAELAIKNPDIEVLGEYITAIIPILHRCKKDGYIWMARPANILFGHGCPLCAGNMLRTTEQYVEMVHSINPNIEVLGGYINSSTPIIHKCKIDGCEWATLPYVILSGGGCPICGNKKTSEALRKTHDEYVKEVSERNPDVEIVGQYINSRTPILHKCKLDGCEWMARPYNILFGKGCPVCQESKGERIVRQWLESNKIKYIPQKRFDDCRDKNPLPFDFYLPDYNICIEYNGGQHYEPVDFAGKGPEHAMQQFIRIQYHDSIKSEYCKNSDISLLVIPYFKNIEEELNNFLFI